MKYIFLLIFFSINCFANTFEVIGGGLTYHITADNSVSKQFSNQISTDGKLIDNPIVGISYTDENKDEFMSYILFTGQNSFNEGMTGILFENGYVYNRWQYGIGAGVYAENSIDWNEYHAIPFYLCKIGNAGIVPVFGGVLNYKIPLNKTTYFKINNIISPILTNSSLSFGWNF